MLGMIVMIIMLVIAIRLVKALWGLAKFAWKANRFVNGILTGRLVKWD